MRTLFKIFLIFFIISIAPAHADINSGLVGWWKFDEASGNAVDSSGNGNTGTPTGTTIMSGCKRAGCRTLNGSSDYVDIANATNFDFNNTTFSLSLWFKTSSSASSYILAKGAAAVTTGGYLCQINADNNGVAAGYLRCLTKDNTGGGGVCSVRSTSSLNIADDKWHLLTAVITTSTTVVGNNTMTIYIDGVVNQGALSNSSGFAYGGTNADRLSLGARAVPSSPNGYFAGSLDDVRVYSRALSAADVADLYRAGAVVQNAVISNGKINQ